MIAPPRKPASSRPMHFTPATTWLGCCVLALCLCTAALASHPSRSPSPSRSPRPPPSSLFLLASETGVWHCRILLNSSTIPELAVLPSPLPIPLPPLFTLHIFLRFTLTPNHTATIQGVILADERPPTLSSNHTPPSKDSVPSHPFIVSFDPRLQLSPSPPSPSRPLNTTVRFPITPISISAYPYGFRTSFPSPSPPAALTTYHLTTSLPGAQPRSCVLNPALLTSRWGPRGPAPYALRSNGQEMPGEAVVVMSPLWGVDANMALLLDWHIQHHVMLGFTRYLVYTRPADLPLLTSSPPLLRWIHAGVLSLLRWDCVPSHPGLPYWDQRLVYNHAVLGHIGASALLLMVDIDEYLVSPQPPSSSTAPSSVFHMLRSCVPPGQQRVNLQMQRAHVIAGDQDPALGEGPAHGGEAELALWINHTDAAGTGQHPLYKHYSLINQVYRPQIKSAVNPNYISRFFIHQARTLPPFNTTRPDPGCMMLAHLKNLFKARGRLSSHPSGHFTQQPSWQAALGRLALQRQRWLTTSQASGKRLNPK